MLKSTDFFVVTPGDPAGIGIDVLLDFFSKHPNTPLIAIADCSVLKNRAAQLELSIDLFAHNNINALLPQPSVLNVIDTPMQKKVIAGKPNPANANTVIETLKLAAQGCLEKQFKGLITGPINKAVINEGGIPFHGHTEYLAKLAGVNDTVMLFASDAFKLALLTTHIPLKEVAINITPERIHTHIKIIHTALKQHFQIEAPRILMCGLNPHAGEGGHLGQEEIETIIPALKKLYAEGIDVEGPISADSAFNSHNFNTYDVILALYHDQGLPVLKYQSFGNAVNVTLGLPFIRTSVDHGTAFDLAGTGKADSGSFAAAVNLAIEMSNRNENIETYP